MEPFLLLINIDELIHIVLPKKSPAASYFIASGIVSLKNLPSLGFLQCNDPRATSSLERLMIPDSIGKDCIENGRKGIIIITSRNSPQPGLGKSSFADICQQHNLSILIILRGLADKDIEVSADRPK